VLYVDIFVGIDNVFFFFKLRRGYESTSLFLRAGISCNLFRWNSCWDFFFICCLDRANDVEFPLTGDRDDADVPCEPSTNLPVDGAGWVDVFVKEMMSATSLDDARARATRVLEFFEQSVSGQAGAEAVKSVQKVLVNSYMVFDMLCFSRYVLVFP